MVRGWHRCFGGAVGIVGLVVQPTFFESDESHRYNDLWIADGRRSLGHRMVLAGLRRASGFEWIELSRPRSVVPGLSRFYLSRPKLAALLEWRRSHRPVGGSPKLKSTRGSMRMRSR